MNFKLQPDCQGFSWLNIPLDLSDQHVDVCHRVLPSHAPSTDEREGPGLDDVWSSTHLAPCLHGVVLEWGAGEFTVAGSGGTISIPKLTLDIK